MTDSEKSASYMKAGAGAIILILLIALTDKEPSSAPSTGRNSTGINSTGVLEVNENASGTERLK